MGLEKLKNSIKNCEIQTRELTDDEKSMVRGITYEMGWEVAYVDFKLLNFDFKSMNEKLEIYKNSHLKECPGFFDGYEDCIMYYKFGYE